MKKQILRVVMASFLALGILLVFSPVVKAETQAQKTDAKAQEVKKININTASAEELATLPRLGPKKAQLIVDFRKKNGNFQRIEDVMKVKGIGEKMFQLWKDRITVK
ncbi:MAG: ComEA family DNA-binding protein [Acidobacteriota bacterium]